VLLAGLGTLIVLRFLFGAGEAGAYPNITRALHNWFPIRQRATAQGFIWIGGRLVGGLTPLLFMVLVTGTKMDAAVDDLARIVRVVGHHRLRMVCGFRALVSQSARRTSASKCRGTCGDRTRPTTRRRATRRPLARIFAEREPVVAMRHVFLPQLRLEFSSHLFALVPHLSISPRRTKRAGALYKGGTVVAGAVGCLIGGLVADRLTRRTGNPDRVRRRLCSMSLVLAGLCWLAAIYATNIHGFVLAVSLAACFNDLTMPSAWAVCQTIGGRYAGMAARA